MKDPSADLLDQREAEKWGKLVEGLLSLPLGNDPTMTVSIGASLPEPEWDQLLGFLRDNSDVFAWTPFDMFEIPSEVITHKLNVDPNFRLV